MKSFYLSIVIILLMNSACIRKETADMKPPELSERWAVAQSITTSDHYILVKTPFDLEKALQYIGCGPKPCSVGRVGEVYVVTRAGEWKCEPIGMKRQLVPSWDRRGGRAIKR